jgi:hypothetical protein
VQQPQRPFLFELQCLGRPRADPPDAAGELRDFRADARFCQHFQAERQGGGTDVVPSLDSQCVRDRRQVIVVELAVAPGEPGADPARGRRRPADRRKQAEHVPVPEHPG